MKLTLVCLFILCCSLLSSSLMGQTTIDSLEVTPDSLALHTSDSVIPAQETNKTNIKPISKDAVEKTVNYDARDSIKIDNQTKVIYLYGEAVVTYDGIKLEAPMIEIFMETNELFAYGVKDSAGKYIKPKFTDPNSSFESHNIRYNFQTQKGKIKDILTEEAEGLLEGENVKKMDNDIIYIQNGKYSICDGDVPCYHLQSKKIKVIPNDKIISGPALLHIHEIPTPILLPFAILPNNTSSASGVIIPSFGGNNATFGFSLQRGGYFWAINDYLNFELTGDIFSKGSWGLHGIANYRQRYKRNGNIQFDYLKWISGDPMIPSEYSNRSDFKVVWGHRQDPKARPNGTFSANVNFSSRTYNQNDISTQMTNARLDAATRSSIDYSFNIPNSIFRGSINASQSQNNLTGVQTVTLPNFTLNMNRIFLRNESKIIGKPKWYQNFNLSYNMAANNTVTFSDTIFDINNLQPVLDNFENGIRHNIPIAGNIKTKYFNITPSANFSSRWYFESITRDSLQNEAQEVQGFRTGNDFNAGINLQTVIYGDFVPMQIGPKRRIVKLRHMLTPNIGFRYAPDFTNDFFNEFSGYQVYYDSLGNSYDYNIFQGGVMGTPGRGQSGSITMSLNNTLQMKVNTPKDTAESTKKISIFDRFTVGTSYNLFADSLNLAPIAVSANTNITKGLSFNVNGSFDPYQLDDEFQRINHFSINNGPVARLTNARLAMRWQLRGKKDKDDQGAIMQTILPGDYEFYLNNPDLLIDFNIPWSLSFSYNLNFRQQIVDDELTLEESQTLNFNGDLRVTQGWKVQYSSGYDFENKNITSNTRFSINRSLSCWEMSLAWVPFGFNANYLFTIRAKSAMLKDLKFDRNKQRTDYGQL